MSKIKSFTGEHVSETEQKAAMAYYIYTALHYSFWKKNSRPAILVLTTYETTSATILKHVSQKTTHEEVYIHIIILKVNA